MPSSSSSLADPTPKFEPRRSKRIRTEKNFGEDFFTYLIEDTPSSYLEAMTSPDAPFWKEAINNEIEYIIENNTWILTDLPPKNKSLECKWIFKKKNCFFIKSKNIFSKKRILRPGAILCKEYFPEYSGKFVHSFPGKMCSKNGYPQLPTLKFRTRFSWKKNE